MQHLSLLSRRDVAARYQLSYASVVNRSPAFGPVIATEGRTEYFSRDTVEQALADLRTTRQSGS
jgi:hypothetical protein